MNIKFNLNPVLGVVQDRPYDRSGDKGDAYGGDQDGFFV
jgi:hypothetical protein